jgi:hypothetical protein
MVETQIVGEVILEQEKPKKDILNNEFHFYSGVYWVEKPEFLETAKFISKQYLNEAKKNKPKDELMNKLFPVTMSASFGHEAKINPLAMYIASTAWNILNGQGYAMDNYEVFLMDFWAQEHHMRSSNEEHIHGFGSQITGFYILDAPEDCSRITVFDPRPGKKQINLPERDMSKITQASPAANYIPKAGNLYLLNSWLPHGFTRHGSEKPLKFIHFNLGARPIQKPPVSNTTPNNVEIV